MIIAYHFVFHSNWPPAFQLDTSINYILCFLGSFGRVGVGLFFIISGFHMAQSKNLSVKKILPIAYKTWFYSLAIFFFLLLFFPNFMLNEASSGDIISSFFPILTNGYWFVSQLIVIRLLYPYIRQWLDNMSNSALIKCFAIITLALILPNFITIPLGSYQQFIFVLPTALYYSFIGYLIYRFKSKFTTKIALSIFILSMAIIIVLPLFSPDIDTVFTLTSSEYPLCIALSAALFRLFLNLRISSKPINYIGGLTFGIYLIHDNNLIRQLLWKSNNAMITHIYNTPTSPGLFLLQAILIILCIFISCALIEAIRQLITTQLVKIAKPCKETLEKHIEELAHKRPSK